MLGHDYSKNYVRGQGHSDSKIVCHTLPSQDACTHQIWDFYLKEYGKYASDTKQAWRTDGQHYKMPPKSLFGV